MSAVGVMKTVFQNVDFRPFGREKHGWKAAEFMTFWKALHAPHTA
jgi:cytosine/uracil/thiamine/allantoin permease